MTNPVIIGDATLYHGDCLEILPTLPKVDAVITDPPYGIGFKSGWTGAQIISDADVSVRDAALALVGNVPAAVFGAMTQPEPKGVRARVIWHRPGSGMGDLAMPWKPDHEVVYVTGAGWRAKRRGDGVLRFPWDEFRGDASHPHRKPVALMVHFIERAPAGLVLDPFMGSGTTGVACAQLGRKFIGIEIERKYFDIACERIDNAYRQQRLFA